jgi:hypothetical protein
MTRQHVYGGTEAWPHWLARSTTPSTEVGPAGGGRESPPVLAGVCVALVSGTAAGGD